MSGDIVDFILMEFDCVVWVCFFFCCCVLYAYRGVVVVGEKDIFRRFLSFFFLCGLNNWLNVRYVCIVIVVK